VVQSGTVLFEGRGGTGSHPAGCINEGRPVASTKEEKNISGWVSLRNRAAGVSVTLSPSDKLVTAWLASSTANK
jgi:hypothetical protein